MLRRDRWTFRAVGSVILFRGLRGILCLPKAEARIRPCAPELPNPVANYVHAGGDPGNLLFLAGKGPIGVAGKVGAEFSEQQRIRMGTACRTASSGSDAPRTGKPRPVTRVVKILGFVNAAPEFQNHPQVINGCSDLMVSVFSKEGAMPERRWALDPFRFRSRWRLRPSSK